MTFKLIQYEVIDDVASITLDDPARRNALSRDMGREVLAALVHAGKQARAVILRGAGNTFCSGANLGEGGFDLTDPERDVGRGLETVMNPLILELKMLAVPLIVAMRGPAIGIGASVAMMGDIILAAPSAYFMFSFRAVGLVPDGGAAWLLSRAIGRVRAMDLMLSGRRFTAQEAQVAGLITRILPDDTLDDAAMTQAQDLASGATAALAMIRASVWSALETDFASQLACDRELQMRAGRTADFVEGVTAFREKRSPKFQGR